MMVHQACRGAPADAAEDDAVARILEDLASQRLEEAVTLLGLKPVKVRCDCRWQPTKHRAHSAAPASCEPGSISSVTA